MTDETRQSPTQTVSHDLRITDRTGLVHVVTYKHDTFANTACGITFSIGRGRPRVWQLVRGHHHEICITCSKQLNTSHRPEERT